MRFTVTALTRLRGTRDYSLRVSQTNAATPEGALRWAVAAAEGERLRVVEATVAEGWPQVKRFKRQPGAHPGAT